MVDECRAVRDDGGCHTSPRPRTSAAGRNADAIAARLVHAVIRPLLAGGSRLVFALDDTPTPRYGPHVQGAGVHHNPCPGPAGSPFVSGHVWVALGLLAAHPLWGVLALPLLARLYVRRKDLDGTPVNHRPAFRAKLEWAVALWRWAQCWLGCLGRPRWVVADGAYAEAPFRKPAVAFGVTGVSRLRKDAAPRTEPGPRRPGRRGRPRVYGERRVELVHRAGHRRGWVSESFVLYGEAQGDRGLF